MTLEELLRSRWKAPKKQIHLMRMEKSILVDGSAPAWTSPLIEGSRLGLKLFAEEDFGVKPAYHEIDVLYEDDHMLILNKPAGMDTHPNEPMQEDTLANAAAFHLLAKGAYRQVKHIHRLDKDTTGAVLFAKHALAGGMLDQLLKERKIKRTYIAMADGVIKQKKGVIRKPIGRDRHHPTRRRVSPGGQDAVTHYEVAAIFPREQQTLVSCRLETGRTHQIRVHFSDMGHPLTGDRLYGGSPAFPRQALHAAKLEVPHPFTEEAVVCYAPVTDCPEMFRGFQPEEL